MMKTEEKKRSRVLYFILLAYVLTGMATIMLFDGTGDDGDSIMHYLFARYASVHPALFVDHWAKPVFVILASPFAQFGFNGMKFFNLVVSLIAFYLTYLTAKSLNIPNSIVVVVFLIFTPLYYVLTFSGLTEPLFALFLVGSVYLVVINKGSSAALLVSFLPFVRSEGLIMLGVFGVYFILSRQWKSLPMLLAGHLFFSLAGFFVYHDLLWVFTRIPYASMESKYGSGPLLHFVSQLNYVIGVPLYILLGAGLGRYVVAIVKRDQSISREEYLLVLSGFLVFIVAHSLFWYFGIFQSMGLKRVLLGIVPLAALIALRGFNVLLELLSFGNIKVKYGIGSLMLLYVIVFPFTGNPAAVNWKTDMQLTDSQRLAQGVAAWNSTNPSPTGARLFYSVPYLSVALKTDPFNRSRRQDLSAAALSTLQPGDRVIWDTWFAVTESKVTLTMLEQMPGLEREIDFAAPGKGGGARIVIFRKY